MIILQGLSNPDIDCLSNLQLAGIFLAGVAATAFLTWLYNLLRNRNNSIDISANLISNEQALTMIGNYHAQGLNDNTASGHLELETLMAYIASMQDKCTTAGKTLSGLEYFFAKYGQAEHPPNQNLNTIVFYPTYVGTIDGHTGHIPFDPDATADSVKVMSDERKSGALRTAWANSNNVLNRTHMSPPREPLTL